MKNYILVFVILFALSACGGGGGGSSASSATNWTSTKCTGSYTNSDGITVPCAYQTFNTTQNSTTGSYDSSTYNTDNYGVISSASTSAQYLYKTSSGNAYSWGPYIQSKTYTGSLTLAEDHLTDVTGLITSAWANGWTGTGTTINIIDDHQSDIVAARIGTFTDHTMVGSYNSSGTQCNYTVSGDITSDMTHGAIVTAIAGGDKRSVSGFDFEMHPSSATVNSGQSGCRSASYFDGGSNEYLTGTTTIEYVPGVAKNATIILSNVDLSSRQNPTNTAQVLEGHIQNSSSYTAVNLSLGYLSPGGIYDWDWYKANHASIFSMSSNPVGVYVIAAGNEGAACSAANFVDCNEIAAIAVLNSTLGDQSIVAGATKVESGVKTVASYSNRAGVMKDRFLLASGSCGYVNDATGNAVEGTSCAAPRIAGAAAILKSKFSNLTGANVADILLLTADKDINDDGTDDFSSTDANFGRGELDLSSALSPVGNLTP